MKNERRAGCVLTDGKNFLICHAPNKKYENHSWDLPKGHCEEGETYIETAFRELREETGLWEADLDVLRTAVSKVYKYGKDVICFIIIRLKKIPEKELVCESMFDWDGRPTPEVTEYRWCGFDELKEKLYIKLSNIVPAMLSEHEDIWKIEK